MKKVTKQEMFEVQLDSTTLCTRLEFEDNSHYWINNMGRPYDIFTRNYLEKIYNEKAI